MPDEPNWLAEQWRQAYGTGAAGPAYTDPATTQLPHALYGDPRHNPIAFIPIDDNEPVDVPPRVDDWCEDRPPSELSDDDGFD